MMRSVWGAIAWLVAQGVLAQAGTVEVTADGCKLHLPQAEARGASRIRWSGKCADGLADGRGVVRLYVGGKISRVSEATFSAGKLSGAGETYFIRGGHAVRSRGGDQLEIAASELPTWALELSMLVEERPRAAPKPAAKAPEKDLDEARRAEQQRQAEAQKARAEAKAAADKLAAERAAQESERKRLIAERDRAIAEAKAAAERAAAAERRAAEKAAAAADKDRAERERAVAEARAAADAKAQADRIAAEKSAQEAEQRRQQAEKERQLADAKAAADKAAEEAANRAKAAAERPRAPFVAGRGFGEGGAGEAMRGVVTFKLTTQEGRELGVATFVAGKGEAELRQNAAALASAYEKVSPFNAKLFGEPQVGATCGGPGYVVEARLTYPAAKAFGWYAGCMGDNLESAAKAMQQLEEQMHRDFKASPASFWAYQYLIVGYVDAGTMRNSGEYEKVAKPGLMAPGRVMVLSKAEQWAECTLVVNKDPKLKDKAACLREAVEKLKTSLRR